MSDEPIMTDAEFALVVQAMADAGKRAGIASGSWIADGNTSNASLAHILEMWETGDPAAPCSPSPFSGEWAGNPSIDDVIADSTDCDPETLTPEERDELATAFEDAFAEHWQAEAEATVRGLLGHD